jgi:hypothetical protein
MKIKISEVYGVNNSLGCFFFAVVPLILLKKLETGKYHPSG